MYDVARWESSEPWGLEQEGTDMFPELSLKDTVPKIVTQIIHKCSRWLYMKESHDPELRAAAMSLIPIVGPLPRRSASASQL